MLAIEEAKAKLQGSSTVMPSIDFSSPINDQALLVSSSLSRSASDEISPAKLTFASPLSRSVSVKACTTPEPNGKEEALLQPSPLESSFDEMMSALPSTSSAGVASVDSFELEYDSIDFLDNLIAEVDPTTITEDAMDDYKSMFATLGRPFDISKFGVNLRK